MDFSLPKLLQRVLGAFSMEVTWPEPGSAPAWSRSPVGEQIPERSQCPNSLGMLSSHPGHSIPAAEEENLQTLGIQPFPSLISQ